MHLYQRCNRTAWPRPSTRSLCGPLDDPAPALCRRFLLRIEEGYLQDIYHSRAHAADVLRSLHVLLTRGGVLEAVVGSARLLESPDCSPHSHAEPLTEVRRGTILWENLVSSNHAKVAQSQMPSPGYTSLLALAFTCWLAGKPQLQPPMSNLPPLCTCVEPHVPYQATNMLHRSRDS